MDRTILHADMDAFFAAVEQLDHPEWRGRPVIVGSGPHERGVVSTCSYEASFAIREKIRFAMTRARIYATIRDKVNSVLLDFTRFLSGGFHETPDFIG